MPLLTKDTEGLYSVEYVPDFCSPEDGGRTFDDLETDVGRIEVFPPVYYDSLQRAWEVACKASDAVTVSPVFIDHRQKAESFGRRFVYDVKPSGVIIAMHRIILEHLENGPETPDISSIGSNFRARYRTNERLQETLVFDISSLSLLLWRDSCEVKIVTNIRLRENEAKT